METVIPPGEVLPPQRCRLQQPLLPSRGESIAPSWQVPGRLTAQTIDVESTTATAQGNVILQAGIPNAHVGDDEPFWCGLIMDRNVHGRRLFTSLTPGLWFRPQVKEFVKSIHQPSSSPSNFQRPLSYSLLRPFTICK